MRKILYIVPHRYGRSPGQRFRCEQYLEFLAQHNFEITYSNLITEKEDTTFYTKGKYFAKFILLLKYISRRYKDIRRASDFDIIFIYREAFFLGTTYFEKQIAKRNKNIIFDFDDSIWLNDVSHGNADLKWLKRSTKTADIIKLSKMIFAGNNYLASYASSFNKNIKIIPTTIDTEYHKKNHENKKNHEICIGWTGTSTTLKHFETSISALKKIKQKYQTNVYFKVIVDFPYQLDILELKAIGWSKNTEIADLCEFDIGIMPLPDDEWSKGKCGFKGLQYMALEIPTIMSPVGVNSEIIQDSENGFLASTEDEWVEKLSLLIESPELREKMGKAGRQTVVEKYSVDSQKHNYLHYFNELLEHSESNDTY